MNRNNRFLFCGYCLGGCLEVTQFFQLIIKGMDLFGWDLCANGRWCVGLLIIFYENHLSSHKLNEPC